MFLISLFPPKKVWFIWILTFFYFHFTQRSSSFLLLQLVPQPFSLLCHKKKYWFITQIVQLWSPGNPSGWFLDSFNILSSPFLSSHSPILFLLLSSASPYLSLSYFPSLSCSCVFSFLIMLLLSATRICSRHLVLCLPQP